jgi:rRNA maturation protein Nop10
LGVCGKCGSNAKWVGLDTYKCPNGHEGRSYTLHFEAWEAGEEVKLLAETIGLKSRTSRVRL